MQDQETPERSRVVVKFATGRRVAFRDRVFVSSTEENLSPLNDLLRQESDAEVYSLFGPSAEGDQQSFGEEQVPDLSRYYGIALGDADRAERLANELAELPFVEEAYVEPPTTLAFHEYRDGTMGINGY